MLFRSKPEVLHRFAVLICARNEREVIPDLLQSLRDQTYDRRLFTVFVMTHFFYLFCARAFETGRSALHFNDGSGLPLVAAVILIGQIAMIEIPGLQNFFNVVSLRLEDWIIIIVGSSCVLWVRELWRLLKNAVSRKHSSSQCQ